MKNFDPNSVAVPNGNIFGFPVLENEADIVLIPVPWDVTASYGNGTSDGPEAILNASLQMDFHHPELKNAHLTKVFMSPVSIEWKELNDKHRKETSRYLEFLGNGGELSESQSHSEVVKKINTVHQALCDEIHVKTKSLIEQGKTVGILGGEHSVPLGLLTALNKKHDNFGILQIDAHADLRNSYEGFDQSHASIMHNVIDQCGNMSKLVQVGVRDVAPIEIDVINNSKGKVQTFFDWEIKEKKYCGRTWEEQVQIIISSLPQKVYISLDIDGLNPSLCPSTGTPVPGGFSLEEINYLLFSLLKSGRQIIGFDLCEVAPGIKNEWDANVGARALWNLVVLLEKQRRKK